MKLNVLHSYGYADIYRWGGSSVQFEDFIEAHSTRYYLRELGRAGGGGGGGQDVVLEA